jgi:uncharacterized protein YqjF (DUF2071 family)
VPALPTPAGFQRWNQLLFAHWPVPAQEIQATLPPGLEVDRYAGRAYLGIVPFSMQRIRPRRLPPLPWISWFLELNVRTYVRDAAGRPGVWFYSLDCNQPVAVALARRFYHLPYFHARMRARAAGSTITYDCRRRGLAAADSRFIWSTAAAAGPAAPGSLEFFLVERYRLFSTDRAGRLYEGQVQHHPYQIHPVELEAYSVEPARQAGFALQGAPTSVLGARAVDVTVYPLRLNPGRQTAG